MNYLLDSGVWLWSIDAVERISRRGLEVLNDSQLDIHFSAASVWELTVKARLKKLTPLRRPRIAFPHSLPNRVCVPFR